MIHSVPGRIIRHTPPAHSRSERLTENTRMDQIREKSPIELELLQRARNLIPALKSRSAQADKDCKLPDDTVRDMQEAG